MFHKEGKLTFKRWILLEQLKSDFCSAAEKDDFPDRIFAYLSTALNTPVSKLEKQTWGNTVLSLTKTLQKYPRPKGIPILDSAPQGGKEVDWDYSGRNWVFYSSLIAASYGWTLEYIADLEVGEAFAHIQEILTAQHLEHEFTYGLSEIAYPYNKSTKKSEFKPMKRPYWMKPVMKEVKKVKIRRDLLPVGRIQNVHGLPEEFKSIATETTNPPRNP